MLEDFVEQWMSLEPDARTVVIICFVIQVIFFRIIVGILRALDED